MMWRGTATSPAAPACNLSATDESRDFVTADRKRWLRVQAELLLAGFPAALIEGDDGKPLLIVTRWSMTKSFDSLREAEAWLVRVRGRA